MASALPKCKHAIEIDLSSNGVGDAGALALAAALAAGGAPELLTLDLRGNGSTLTKDGIDALRAVERRGLMVLADEVGGEKEKGKAPKERKKKGKGGSSNDDKASSDSSSPVPPSSSSSDPLSSSSEDDDDDERSSNSGSDEQSDGESSGRGWSTGSASLSPSSPSFAQNLPPGEAVERLIGDARKALMSTAKKKKKKADASSLSASSASASSASSPSPVVVRPRAAAAALFAAGAALAAEAAALAARPGGGLGGATVTVFGTAMRLGGNGGPSDSALAWPPPPGTRLSGLPPGARAAAEKAPATLARALDTAPPDDPMLGGPESVRKLACGLPLTPGVGTHRVAAAALVARLLSLRCPNADARIAASGALPKLLALALKHGHCSALQAHALAALRSALESPCEKLWMPLFVAEKEAEGKEEGREGVGGKANGGNGDENGGSKEPPPPLLLLPAALAQAVTEATASLLPGKRPTGHAFAVAASAVLLEVSGERKRKKAKEDEEKDDDSSSGSSGSGERGESGDDKDAAAPTPSSSVSAETATAASAETLTPSTPAVRAALSSCPRWLAAARGPLAAVLAEQEGELCGPRPSRDVPAPQEESFFGGGAGGRIDGQQLLQLLRSIQQL